MSSHQRHELNDSGSDNAPKSGDEVLGSLSGAKDAPMMGQNNPPASPPPPSAPQPNEQDPIGGLLGSLLGGAGGGAQGGAQPGGDLGGLLGSLLGGGAAPNTGGSNAQDPMGGLLGGLLGGMGGNASPNMGAMGNMSGLNSILAPLADKLADKAGIPRQTAEAVVAVIAPMIINKLMNSGQQGAASMQREGLTFTSGEKQEMVQQIASQTGLDHHAATNTLNQALQALTSQ